MLRIEAHRLEEQKGELMFVSMSIFFKRLRLTDKHAPKSSIIRHLLDSGHEVEISKQFKIINRQTDSNL